VGKAYSEEVSSIPQTLQWTIGQNITVLERCIRSCADKSVVAIGSGGSFTAAAYVAGLHERKYGKLSRAATPLDAITGVHGGDFASIYLSAEGRNNDILAAAQAHCGSDKGSIALTLVPANPLLAYCESSGAATPVYFDIPWQKDGYLATNTLVAMMALFGRAYFDGAFVTGLPDNQWITARREELAISDAVSHIVCGSDVIVLYGAAGKVAAIDLESKFAEAALGPCQVVDYRQFAHGRHLQLAQRKLPVVIALGSEEDEQLMQASLGHFPVTVPILRIQLPTEYALSELVGVVYAMLIVEAVSLARQIDVGQPDVPAFGRALYGTDVRDTARRYSHMVPPMLRQKVPGLQMEQVPAWVHAADAFIARLDQARFAGIVCDFDGTCCYTPRRWEGIDHRLIDEFTRILHAGIKVAFATGRGDSIKTTLCDKLPAQYWARVFMGYFSGSSISWLDEEFREPAVDARFSQLRSWLIEHCLISGGLTDVKLGGGQMSIRLSDSLPRDALTSAIAFWIDAAGYAGWRVFCSGHSVDVLTEAVGKRVVVDRLSEQLGADPNDEILRIGDAGHFSGNDYELLSSGLGLSVAMTSPLKASCWNLLPEGLHGAAGTHYYLSALEIENGKARFSEKFIKDVRAMLLQVEVRP